MKNVTKEELKKIVENSKSKADICRALELVPKGGNYTTIDRLLKANGLIWNKSIIPWNKGKCYRSIQHKNIYEILIKNSSYRNTYALKLRLFNKGLKENKCEICGYTESTELHHINGDSSDNRLENLQVLCPNCHSKTENYRAKNINKGKIIQNPITPYLSEEEIKQRELERKAKKAGKSLEEYISYQKNKKRLKSKICLVCGKEFNPNSSTQKYCSVECYRENNKGNRPTLVQLIKDFKELSSFVQVGLKYNVSDNAVRKWCKLYGLPIKSKEIREYINSNF